MEYIESPERMTERIQELEYRVAELERAPSRKELMRRLAASYPLHPARVGKALFLALFSASLVTLCVSFAVPFVAGENLRQLTADLDRSLPVPLPMIFAVCALCLGIAWVTAGQAAMSVARDCPMLPWEADEKRKIEEEIKRLTAQRSVADRLRGTPMGARPRISTPVPLSSRTAGATPSGPPRMATPSGPPRRDLFSQPPMSRPPSHPPTPGGPPRRATTPLGPPRRSGTPIGPPGRAGTPISSSSRFAQGLNAPPPTGPLARMRSSTPTGPSRTPLGPPSRTSTPLGPMSRNTGPGRPFGTPVGGQRRSSTPLGPTPRTPPSIPKIGTPVGNQGMSYAEPSGGDAYSDDVATIDEPVGYTIGVEGPAAYTGTGNSFEQRYSTHFPKWGPVDEPWLEDAIEKAEILASGYPVQAHLEFSPEGNLPFSLILERATPAMAVRAMVSYIDFLASIATPPRARIELRSVAHLDRGFHRNVSAALEQYYPEGVTVTQEAHVVEVAFATPDEGWARHPYLPIVE